MSDIALIETARDFNRFYTNFLGLLNKAYLDTPFTLTDARILFEVASHEGVSAAALVRDLQLDPLACGVDHHLPIVLLHEGDVPVVAEGDGRHVRAKPAREQRLTGRHDRGAAGLKGGDELGLG